MKAFPVADRVLNRVKYSDDFNAPRSGGRTHQATDVFATEGAIVVAPDDGWLTYAWDGYGGATVTLDTNDGVHYYGAHLSAWITDQNELDTNSTHPSPPKKRWVDTGAPIGRVGTTGNARGTLPHLHLSMKVGGVVVDPYGYLRAAEGIAPLPAPPLPPKLYVASTARSVIVVGATIVVVGGITGFLLYAGGGRGRGRRLFAA
jgi:murein DD-endopeptidase MepM/ murein hydrolase activator NlpD